MVLDAEVINSTYSETFKKEYPQRFFEMFIAEQNMAGAACGLAARGKVKEVVGEKTSSRSPEPDICTKAPEWAEHVRLSDADEPCDDGRSGRL